MLLDFLLTRSPASLSQVPAIPAAAEAAEGCSRNDKEVIRSIHPSGWAAAAMRRGAAGGGAGANLHDHHARYAGMRQSLGAYYLDGIGRIAVNLSAPAQLFRGDHGQEIETRCDDCVGAWHALLLTGCVSAPGTYPSSYGPRNGAGFLVDPQTGLELPGQPDIGGPGN